MVRQRRVRKRLVDKACEAEGGGDVQITEALAMSQPARRVHREHQRQMPPHNRPYFSASEATSPRSSMRHPPRIRHHNVLDSHVLCAAQIDPLLPHDRFEDVQSWVVASHNNPLHRRVVAEVIPRLAVAEDLFRSGCQRGRPVAADSPNNTYYRDGEETLCPQRQVRDDPRSAMRSPQERIGDGLVNGQVAYSWWNSRCARLPP